MKQGSYLLWAMALVLSACAAPGGIEVKGAWVRASQKDGNSAAYMILVNQTDQGDKLMGVASDAAQSVELHLSQAGANGVMQMLPQDSIDLPAGGTLELRPGSYHVMLMGLRQDLNPGGTITIVLDFESHPNITVTIPVKDSAEMGGTGMDGHNVP